MLAERASASTNWPTGPPNSSFVVLELSEKTPQTCDSKPDSLRAINSIDETGGIPAVMKNISSLLDLDVLTIAGRRLGDILDEAVIKASGLIRPMEDPVRLNGGP